MLLQIYANMALAKADAEVKEKEKKTKEPKDSRNLFLSREGLIREGTQAAQVKNANEHHLFLFNYFYFWLW